MTVHVDPPRLSICSCSHLPVAPSHSPFLPPSQPRQAFRRELLWEFSASLFAKAYLFTDFQSK